VKLFAPFVVLALLFSAPACADTQWKLVHSYPHDAGAFTQGLLFHDGSLYESTGQYGASSIREVRLKDGKVLREHALPGVYFGEGMTLWNDMLLTLTWRNGLGFCWSLSEFKQSCSFSYTGEGWGLTHNGTSLIMSDGSADIRFLDPATYAEQRRITVTWNDRPVLRLNELEYVKGEILANVWMTDRIARINPETGAVIDWIDLSALTAKAQPSSYDAVLNGIAYDAKADRLFVTGKYWPKLFEIRLKAGPKR